MLRWVLILIGIYIQSTGLAGLGLLVFSAGALFALATLPVELNASARAKQMLTDTGLILGDDERRGVNKVLNAAALTYVAALVTAVMQLLYFASLVFGMGRRND
jgi:Zn-dependent membrane protease YugP